MQDVYEERKATLPRELDHEGFPIIAGELPIFGEHHRALVASSDDNVARCVGRDARGPPPTTLYRDLVL